MESQVVPSSGHRLLHSASFLCRLLPKLREYLLPRAAALSQRDIKAEHKSWPLGRGTRSWRSW